MRFLADESCDFRVVLRLRTEGLDVLAVSEIAAGATDLEVLALAREQSRVLLTEDRDFGRLVFAGSDRDSPGILYVRCTETARPGLPEDISRLVKRLGSRLVGSFTVWSPVKVRIRRAPSPRADD